MNTINQSILLCDLHDSAFEFGGIISNALRAAGHDESSSVVIGQLRAWSWTVAELLEFLS